MAKVAECMWPGMGGVRVRTTVAAVAVIVVAIGAGAVLLLGALRTGLVDEVEQSAQRQAAEVLAALAEGDAQRALAVSDDDEELVQVVAGDGEVLAASDNVQGRDPVVPVDQVDDTVTVDVVLDEESEELLVVAEDGEVDGREVVVLVGRSLDEATEPTEAVRSLLWVGGPLLAAMVAVTTWFVVGRALAPVGRIRREVEHITFSEMHRRVHVPAARDEIARLAETMNGMLARLDAGQERQRRFVADASHELRSPLASLRQHAEVALAHGDRVQVGDLAEVMQAESVRMQRLVDDLLLLARSDEGSLTTTRRPVDVDDLVFGEARRLRDAGVVQVDTSRVGAGRVRGDGAALRRVIANLADNAARHATHRVAFILETRRDEVIVHVDDDGSGIPVDERQRVLDRFVRLDEGRARDTGGAGLGLAIAAEVVTAHGGTLTVEESPMGGARLTVRLSGLPE